ncbi:transcription antitermination factor NusB [Cephaloticoccus primus]|uniref:transcription antitermination factor NusB n=1 Tax=Cephaloticoccus primus TaxID=1548207 RepID=UPI0009ED45E8|nr:transcription antitermination factor NusB [Cephaloticoccus primus]
MTADPAAAPAAPPPPASKAPPRGPFAQRRDGRVAALQYLFAWSMNVPQNLAVDLSYFFDTLEHPRDHYAFGEELINGVIEQVADLDASIKGLAHNWEFSRIARMDLTILRLAMYEMKFRKDIPPIVSINEAIDLSKQFSSGDSRRFINGILDRFKDQLGRDARKA